MYDEVTVKESRVSTGYSSIALTKVNAEKLLKWINTRQDNRLFKALYLEAKTPKKKWAHPVSFSVQIRSDFVDSTT